MELASYTDEENEKFTLFDTSDSIIASSRYQFDLSCVKKQSKFISEEDGRYINFLREGDYQKHLFQITSENMIYNFFECGLEYLNDIIYSYTIEIEMSEIEIITTKKNIATIYALNKYGFSVLNYNKYNIQPFMFDWDTINKFFVFTDENVIEHYKDKLHLEKILFVNAYNDNIVEKYKNEKDYNYNYVLLRYLSDNNFEIFKQKVIENNIVISPRLFRYFTDRVLDADIIKFIMKNNPNEMSGYFSLGSLLTSITVLPQKELESLCHNIDIYSCAILIRNLSKKATTIFIKNNMNNINSHFFENLIFNNSNKELFINNWYYLLSGLKTNNQRDSFIEIRNSLRLYDAISLEDIIKDVFDLKLLKKFKRVLTVRLLTNTYINNKSDNKTKRMELDMIRFLIKFGLSVDSLYNNYSFDISLVKDIVPLDVYEKYENILYKNYIFNQDSYVNKIKSYENLSKISFIVNEDDEEKYEES